MSKIIKRNVYIVNINELEKLKKEFDDTFKHLIDISKRISDLELDIELKKAVQYREQPKS